MTKPKSPDNYSEFKPYSLPRTAEFLSGITLLFVGTTSVLWMEFTLLYNDPVVYSAAILIGMTVTLYAHESLHYIAFLAHGFRPEFVWPNAVYAPDQAIGNWASISILVAPQILSVLFLGLLLWGVDTELEIVASAGFLLSLVGGATDIPWAVRRLTWPSGALVIVTDEKETFLAFPESGE